jgi:hypothetical protein
VAPLRAHLPTKEPVKSRNNAMTAWRITHARDSASILVRTVVPAVHRPDVPKPRPV